MENSTVWEYKITVNPLVLIRRNLSTHQYQIWTSRGNKKWTRDISGYLYEIFAFNHSMYENISEEHAFTTIKLYMEKSGKDWTEEDMNYLK